MKSHSSSSNVAYAAAAVLTVLVLAALVWVLTRDPATSVQAAFTHGMLAGALIVTALAVIMTLLLARQFRRTGTLMRDIRESELRLNSIIDSAMDALVTVDERQNIVLFNSAAERIFGLKADEAIGSDLDRFIPERYRAAHREHMRRFGEAGVTTRRMGADLVLTGLRANGQEFPIDASISHATVAGQKLYTVILRDVTERQRALETERRIQLEHEESEKRLQSIIGSAMDAIITVDEAQRVLLFNAAAEKIFRCTAGDAIGAPLERFIPPRYRAQHAAHVKRFGEAGVTMRRMGGELVLAGLRSDGEEFPIDASISHVTVGGRKFYTVILRDVTEREVALERQHAAQRQLEESERRLQSIIGSAMDAIITIDEEQNVVLFNAAAERIFGCRARDAVGSPIERFIPERYRATHREHVRRFGEAGVTMRRMGGNLVLAGLRASGEEFPIDASISHVTVSGRKFYTVILRDVTARQRSAEAIERSHRELRELYESMHQVREAERTRIARELHDELAQWLTALKMDAAWIATRLPPEHEQLVRKAHGMKAVVDSTVAAVRRIAADLRPVMLDDLGFMPALENLVNDLSGRAGIEVGLDAEGDFDLREPLATALYRMVQEALTNVARHANATAAVVELRRDENRLQVRVRDDGQGFNPDASRKSYGVLGIRERARTLGGEARIYSLPEGGTIVDIDLPLVVKDAAGAAT